MNSIANDMPVVGTCSVGECAYNSDNHCHARAITVGNGIHPGCDTFLVATPHVTTVGRPAGVGACKVAPCQYNEDYACTAAQIAVGHAGGGACCLTYRQRMLPASPVQPERRPS